jgi:hypothetical protein
MMRRSALVVALFTSIGCAPTTAVVNGQRMPRPDLGYTDHQYYAVQHRRAYPVASGPSSGLYSYGGPLWASVCGANLNLEAEYYGRFLDVSGYITPQRPSGSLAPDQPVRFEVRDRATSTGAVREVHGTFPLRSLLDRYGPLVIDFRFNADRLDGTIGHRRYQLHRDADDRLTRVDDKDPTGLHPMLHVSFTGRTPAAEDPSSAP